MRKKFVIKFSALQPKLCELCHYWFSQRLCHVDCNSCKDQSVFTNVFSIWFLDWTPIFFIKWFSLSSLNPFKVIDLLILQLDRLLPNNNNKTNPNTFGLETLTFGIWLVICYSVLLVLSRAVSAKIVFMRSRCHQHTKFQIMKRQVKTKLEFLVNFKLTETKSYNSRYINLFLYFIEWSDWMSEINLIVGRNTSIFYEVILIVSPLNSFKLIGLNWIELKRQVKTKLILGQLQVAKSYSFSLH